MMPIARALARRGHQLRFTCQPAMVELVRRAGFEAVASGGPTLAAPADRRPLTRLDRAAERRVISDVFAGRVARDRAPRIVDVGRDVQPDVVVRDEMDFGAAAAAERLGVPHASVVVLSAGAMVMPEMLDEPLSQLCADLGLPRDPATFNRFLTIAPVMPSFRDPQAALPAKSLVVRPDVLDAA